MTKQNIYKGLKVFFYLCGFPLLMLFILISLMPMFNVEVMGDYARNWVLIFLAIWAVVEIIRFVVNKFIGKNGDTARNVALVIMAVVSILAVVLPTVIFDAASKPQYQKAQNELSEGVNVKDYDSVSGWHRDFTVKYDSEVYWLINEHYDFMKMYGLQHAYSEWYGNADKENNLGYKIGSFEKVKQLVEQKREAVGLLAAAKEELASVEPAYYAAIDAYNTTPTDENKALVDTLTTDMVRLKGVRVDLTGLDLDAIVSELVDFLKPAIEDIDSVLVDGFVLYIGDFPLDLGHLLGDKLLEVVDLGEILGGLITEGNVMKILNTVLGLVDMSYDGTYLWTSYGDQTVAHYQSMVDGGDSDLSLVQAEALNFKMNNYPAVLAAGAVKYACFICVGLVMLSLILTDFFARKEKQAADTQGGEQND